ncbi:SUKH-4 family immunity protein [Streptomyces sp. NPDC001068]|uniref:SUKH-4 family immunity protein n=1 Tax=Streptomyces sp. NPDC001068 TaxID=3364544 RepID=UPI0036AB62B8
MVTFAQAQERAEEWINGDVPAYQHREVRVREFGLGFVVWGEDRADGPRSDAGGQRLVIARDTGDATLWPALPVGEVIRRYEEEYGREAEVADAVPAPAARVDLNQTSFLLSPPEWLQEAADKLGIPDRRPGADGPSAGRADERTAAGPAGGSAGGPAVGSGVGSGAGPGAGSAGLAQTQAGVPAGAGGSGGPSWPAAGAGAPDTPDVPAGATPWAGTDTNADPGADRSVPLPATVFAPPLSGSDNGALGDAETALMAGGSQLPRTAVSPAVDDTGAPGARGGAQGAPAGAGAPRGGTRGQSSPGAPTYGYPQAPAAPGAPTPGAPAPGTPVPGAHAPGAPAPGGQAPGAPAPGAHAPGMPVPGAPAPGAHAPGASAPGVPAAPPAPSYGYPQSPAAPGHGYPQGPDGAQGASRPPVGPPAAGRPPAPNASDIADAATSRAAPPPRKARGAAAAPPPPPGAPGAPGGRPGGTPPPPPPVGGYVPTQMVSALGPEGPGGPARPQVAPNPQTPPGGTPSGDVHRSETMLAGPGVPGMPNPPGAPAAPGAPGVPPAPGAQPPPFAPGAPFAGGAQPPGAPGAPSAPGAQGAVHHAETVLAAPPVGAPGAPLPPPAPAGPAAPGVPGVPAGAPQMPPPVPAGAMPPPGQSVPGQQPPAYGYPQQGQPTVGPGYQAVLRYRAQDGSEQQLIRRSAPGTPHPEWQIYHELRAMNVPPDQVLELHTELESCELPGAYCARMIREQWPQARLASIAPYGTDHASRQQGMRELLAHQGELHQVAAGPARPAPVRAPLPPVQAAPPVPPEAIAQELGAAFGPGVFRFEPAAVERQGVPPVVAHTLVAAGLPLDMGPFFWAQAQPGRPVPTLAELAQERGVQPAADAGSYLVMGTDFGKAVCVQYGTANIVAVPVEAGPGGAAVPPQFVNTGLPEFARCLALLGRMWRLRFGLNQEQAGRWTVDFQAQLASLDPAALGSPESWWSVLLEQMWDGLL